MARETKEQRQERLNAELLAQEAEAAATYTQRLMQTLERAQKANFELTVRDGKFQLEDRDNRYDVLPPPMGPTYTRENEQALATLLWSVGLKESVMAEAERMEMARTAALGKLTQEERKLLKLL